MIPSIRMRVIQPVKVGLRSFLKWAGKGDRKVAAVFGFTPTACHSVVLHLRKGAPEVPVWLFSTTPPLPETAALCEHVQVHRHSLVLLLQAETQLWRRWVAITVCTWTGEHGKWPLKLAPFLIPPFRALLLNGHGDFFPGTPAAVLLHCRRRLRDAAHPFWSHARDVLRSWCCYPGRVLFKRFHGDQPLRLPPICAGGTGLLKFSQRGSGWDGPGFEKFVLSSNARWILWQEEGVDDPVDDMLPLFADERTFAVSRQSKVRQWKSMLFPMVPFRILQPGCASRVLAPISATILVDRQKLQALAIPRCRLPWTAWLLLFWKAAAAGWRSYAMGQSGQLEQRPDFPLREAGLIVRILSDPVLRGVGPREPDLSRGTIAFTPALQFAARPNSDRLKVLIVSPFLPYPLSHGGAVRIYNLCRALAGRVDFVLTAIREREDKVHYHELHEVFREVYVVDIDEHASKDEQLPGQVRQHQSRSLRALIAGLSRKWKPDLMQIEYTHLAAFRDSAPGVPAILVEHDLTLSLYRQLAESEPSRGARHEYERWLAFERRWLSAYDGVWTVCEEDRQAAIREGNRRPDHTFTVPNGVDIRRFVPREDPPEAPEIFYVGSFRHVPNVLGFEKLRGEIMPRVWSRFPKARLRVVAGMQHEWFWHKFARRDPLKDSDPRIEVHGFVEDLRPLYARASAVVVPLEVSAGTNIKVLEAMACGKAIVTTPVGCAGLGLLDGHDAFIRADWVGFAHAVCVLLSDAALRSSVAAHARQSAEERFSWTAVADCAYESYLTLAARSERRHSATG